jgi:hypothetical protein
MQKNTIKRSKTVEASDPLLDHSNPASALNIDARVHAFRGTWQIESRVGGPSELVVRLPLEPNRFSRLVNRVYV